MSQELFDYTAIYIGGEGPNVWEREVKIDGAEDIVEAAQRAKGWAEEEHGLVVFLSQDGLSASELGTAHNPPPPPADPSPTSSQSPPSL